MKTQKGHNISLLLQRVRTRLVFHFYVTLIKKKWHAHLSHSLPFFSSNTLFNVMQIKWVSKKKTQCHPVMWGCPCSVLHRCHKQIRATMPYNNTGWVLPSVSSQEMLLFYTAFSGCKDDGITVGPLNQCSKSFDICGSFCPSFLSLPPPELSEPETAHILPWQGKIHAAQSQNTLHMIIDGLEERTRPRCEKGRRVPQQELLSCLQRVLSDITVWL